MLAVTKWKRLSLSRELKGGQLSSLSCLRRGRSELRQRCLGLRLEDEPG